MRMADKVLGRGVGKQRAEWQGVELGERWGAGLEHARKA